MVRFLDGVPQAVFYSQHSDGQGYAYNATEKLGVRPVIYVAEGSHVSNRIPEPGSNGLTGIVVVD